MVNRERFMLDVDSEGFPIVDTTAGSYSLAANPRGWDEVDGVPLPAITWAEGVKD